MRANAPPEHCWHDGVCCWCGATDTVSHGPHRPSLPPQLLAAAEDAAGLLWEIGDSEPALRDVTLRMADKLRVAIAAATGQEEWMDQIRHAAAIARAIQQDADAILAKPGQTWRRRTTGERVRVYSAYDDERGSWLIVYNIDRRGPHYRNYRISHAGLRRRYDLCREE